MVGRAQPVMVVVAEAVEAVVVVAVVVAEVVAWVQAAAGAVGKGTQAVVGDCATWGIGKGESNCAMRRMQRCVQPAWQ